MRIDTHQHFWEYDVRRHSWIDDSMQKIRGNFLPEDLIPLLNENRIDGCISVEAHSSEEETNFLLNLAEKNNFIKGVIGWLDLRHPGINERLAHFASFNKFKGVRHALQSEPDLNFMLRSDFQKGVGCLKNYNLLYEILIFPPYLPATIQFVRKHPQQKFVLDHLAKPYIKANEKEPWASQIKKLAGEPNVYAKLSGMVTEADLINWKEEDIKPYLDIMINAFGTSRLMFGSDWPVCLLAGSYNAVFTVVKNFISDLDMDDQNKIMGGNAIECYRL
jgi:L-fuconolactonase